MADDTYVGSRTPRLEDARLLAGRGRYVGNVRLPGMAYAVVVRSPIAHGRLVACGVKAARAADGVLDVITPADAAGIRLPCAGLSPGQRLTAYPVLEETIRYVGQPVAVVVADTPEAAGDAAELVDLDFDQWPAVVGVARALADDASLLYPEWGTNVVTDFPMGDDCEEAIGAAEHVVEMTFTLGRVSPYPMEPRGVVASYDGEELTIRISTQAAHNVREHAADALGLGHDRVRVIGADVGGGFGAKEHLYPDELLACLAATRLGRPVSWTEAPGDRLVATLPSRATVHRGRLALDGDGRFVAVHADIVSDLGAHPSNVGAGPAAVTATLLPGPTGSSGRGPGCAGWSPRPRRPAPTAGSASRRPLVDAGAAGRRGGATARAGPGRAAAAQHAGPEDLPCGNRIWQTYDSGDYPRALRTLREMVTPPGGDDGRRRGVGYSCHVEGTGMGPSMGLKAAGIPGRRVRGGAAADELRRVGGGVQRAGRDRAGHRDHAGADRRRPGGGADGPDPGGAGGHRVDAVLAGRVHRQPGPRGRRPGPRRGGHPAARQDHRAGGAPARSGSR